MAENTISGHAFRVELRTLASESINVGTYKITREWAPIVIPLDAKILTSSWYNHALLVNDRNIVTFTIRPEAAIAIAHFIMAELAIMLPPEAYDGVQVRIARNEVDIIYSISENAEYSAPISGFSAANSIAFSTANKDADAIGK